jgi:hypothetical protein
MTICLAAVLINDQDDDSRVTARARDSTVGEAATHSGITTPNVKNRTLAIRLASSTNQRLTTTFQFNEEIHHESLRYRIRAIYSYT